MAMVSDTKGYFYIRKNRKPNSWSLYYEYYEQGNKQQKKIPIFSYTDYGLNHNLSLEAARAACKRLNKERRLSKEEIKQRHSAAKNLLFLESLDLVLFPQIYIKEFLQRIDTDNFGSQKHLLKIRSHFVFIQKMIKELRLYPAQYKDESKRIYKYLIQRKVSISYAKKLIGLINKWGLFVSKKESRFFEPLPIPKGREVSAIVDSQRTKRGKDTDLGVRTESLALTPELLKGCKDRFNNQKHYNFLLISLWFGLRPYEVESLKDKSKWSIFTDDNTQVHVLKVYQSKLMSVEESKRNKNIPVIFPEQITCLELIKNADFERPHPKTVRNNLKSNTTLYGGRKGFVDLMLSLDQRIEDISLWLGHRSITTTWKSYKEKEKISFVKPAGRKFG